MGCHRCGSRKDHDRGLPGTEKQQVCSAAGLLHPTMVKASVWVVGLVRNEQQWVTMV